MWHLTRVLLGLFVFAPRCLVLLALGAVCWLNDCVRQLWPYIDKAVADIVHAKVKEQLAQLGSLTKYGISEVALQHFSLGPAPQLGGIKLWPADGVSPPNAVCMDIDLRVSGADSNALAHVKLLVGSPLVIQLAALQLRALVRVCFRQLGPKLPPFGAVTVSLMGKPFIDFSLTALSGDLLAIPGLEAAVSAGVAKGVSSLLWPQRLVIPLTGSAEDSAVLHPRPTGILLVRIRQARGLPVTDASVACTDPYVKLQVQGHSMVVETQHLQRTRCPTFNTEGLLPVLDAAHERLSIELWDENSLSADELVSTADLSIADALANAHRAMAASDAAAAAQPVFSDWVPLHRQSVKVTDVSASMAAATGRLRSLVAVSEEKTATSPGGELLLEFTHVPLGASALPQGWALPRGRAIMTVRLLFASQLHVPPGWTARMTPVVTLTVHQGEQEGQQTCTSTPGTGANCAWHETFEFLVELGDDDDNQHQGGGAARPPPPPVRLHLVANAAPRGGIMNAMAGALSGAASSAVSMVTLGVVGGSKPADSGASLNLRGAAGGLLGRQASCEADPGLDASYDATTFCGRAVLDVHDMARKVALNEEPQVVKLDLIDTVAGSLTCVVDIQRLAISKAAASASSAQPSTTAAPEDASTRTQSCECGVPPSRPDGTPFPAGGALPTSAAVGTASVRAATRHKPKRLSLLSCCQAQMETDP